MDLSLNPRPYFIVLEGLDGCGKSTLARALAERLNAALLSTPLAELRDVRAQVDAVFGETGPARVLWYLAHVVRAGERIARLLTQGDSVVVDRFWMTTLAYATCQGTTLEVAEVLRLLPSPDVTLFLTCSAEVRQQRLAVRGSLQPHDLQFLAEAPARRLMEAYRSLARNPAAGRFVELDVGTASPEAACAQALRAMGLETPAFLPPQDADESKTGLLTAA